MSQLNALLNSALKHIGACQAFERKAASTAPNDGSIENYLNWIKEALDGAIQQLQKIKVKNVESNRSNKLSTKNVLEVFVDEAERQFSKEYGVFDCLNKIGANDGQQLDQTCVSYLDRLRKHSKKTVRILYLMARPTRAFLLSWRFVLFIVVGGLILTGLSYALHYAIHPAPGLTPTQTVAAATARDVTTIKQASQQPDTSAFDKGLKTATAVIELLPKVPQAILGFTAAFSLIMALLSKLFKK